MEQLVPTPASTQPNSICKAVGDPGGPHRRPLSNTRMNTSTPGSKSILPGEPNSGSANCISDKCFQLGSSCTDLRGKLVVIHGTITAVTETSLCVELVGDIVKVPTDCTELP